MVRLRRNGLRCPMRHRARAAAIPRRRASARGKAGGARLRRLARAQGLQGLGLQPPARRPGPGRARQMLPMLLERPVRLSGVSRVGQRVTLQMAGARGEAAVAAYPAAAAARAGARPLRAIRRLIFGSTV